MPPVVVAGLTDEQLTLFELSAETAMLAALQTVADQVADQIGAIQTASAARMVWDGCPHGLHQAHQGPCGGGVAVLVAGDPPPVPDIPGPPGQPYVSPDDLNQIQPLWADQVDRTLLPVVAEVYQTSAGTVHTQLVDAANIAGLPPVTSAAAEQYLATARNTFANVGDQLWANARTQLVEGFANGESIPELAARVRGAAQVTAPTAVLVARTQVLDASNSGSIATARASGLALRKGWLSTPDPRTRPSHVTAGHTYGTDQQFIPLADQFVVGGYSCDRPHDPTLPPAERSRCRCTIGYAVSDRSATPVRQERVPPLPGQSDTPAPLPEPATPPAVQAAYDRALQQAAAAEARALAAANTAYSRAVRLAQQAYVRQLAVAGRAKARTERALAQQTARDLRRTAEEAARTERRAAEQAARDARDTAAGRPTAVRAVPGISGPAAPGPGPGTPVRGALRQARTRDQLATAMREEMRHITGREIVIEIPPDASLTSMREFFEGVATSAEQFPDTRLRAISWFTRLDGHYAEAEPDVLRVNSWWFAQTSRTRLVSRTRADADWNLGRNGWMPRNADAVDALGVHEYGHAVHLALGADTRLVSSRALTAVQRHAALEQTSPDGLVARQVGAYATSDDMELVAGAFTDVTINGQAAAPVSREIVDILEQAYHRAGGTPGTAPSPIGLTQPVFAAPARTLTQLRAAVTQHGITIPTGLRQPALGQLVTDLEAGMPPAAARTRAVVAIMDERRAVVSALTEAEELVANGASTRALAAVAARLRSTLNADAAKIARPLLDAMDTGDTAAIRAALPVVARAAKVKPVGAAGGTVKMDRARMLTIGSDDVPAGGAVRVVRAGYETTFEGSTTLLSRAAVVRSDVAVPVKAAKKAAPRKAVAPAAQDVSRMTVPQMRELAAELDIPVPPGATKAQLVARLQVPEPTLAGMTRYVPGAIRQPVGVTRADWELLHGYAGGDFGPANRVLRGIENGERPGLADAFDRLLAGSRTTDDLVVYRGLRTGQGVFGPRSQWPDDFTGFQWTDRGFLSTSVSESSAAEFAGTVGGPGGILLRVRVPRGTGALDLRHAPLDEGEVLLDRGLSLRVVGQSTRQVNGQTVRVLDVDVAPAVPTKGAVAATTPAEGASALNAPRVKLADALQGRSGPLPAGVDADQVRAVERYIAGASRRMPDPAQIGAIDRLMVMSPLDRPIVVWRGMRSGRGAFGPRDKWPRNMTGLEFLDDYFASTSSSRTVARRFATGSGGGLLLRVRVPDGMGAIQISGARAGRIGTVVSESEILLQRGVRYRVVRDLGFGPDELPGSPWAGLRVLEVEAIPSPARAAKAAKKAAPVKAAPAPDRMTPAALRTELRPIIDAAPDQWRLTAADLATVPKSTLAAWTRRARDLDPRLHGEEVGRWRQAIIDRQRAVADLLIEADELIANGANAAAMGVRARGRLRRIEAQLAGWPGEAQARAVVTALETGNPATIRRAVAAAQRKLGLRQVGDQAGTVGRYDRGAMTVLGGGDIPDGASVIVVRPGYEIEVGGRTVVLSRPVVEMSGARPVPVRELLEADDATIEAALRDVYEGQFGPYTTKVKVNITRAGTRTDSRGRVRQIEPDIGVDGKVFDATGREIGYFGRSISPVEMHYPDGTVRREIWAGHSIVQLEPRFQGRGFGGEFNQRAIDWYRASGVRGISLSDHNGYVWASQGFNFGGGIVPEHVIESLRGFIADLRAGRLKDKFNVAYPRALREAADLDAQIRAAEDVLGRAATLQPGDPRYPTAREFSQMGRTTQRGKSSTWLGKHFMFNNGATSELVLNPDQGVIIS